MSFQDLRSNKNRNAELLSTDEIQRVFVVLQKLYGIDIGTELWYSNAFQLLVAVMLSAQATDKSVNKITDKLFLKIKTPQDVIGTGAKKINDLIKTINYHNVKSKHIVEMSKQLVIRHNGKVPDNFEDLIKLSGVGRKTANLVLSLAFKQNRIAVDTHCFRVANRLGLTDATNVLETERQLEKNVPQNFHRDINNLLIPFGREYCKAIKPRCTACPLRSCCKNLKKQELK